MKNNNKSNIVKVVVIIFSCIILISFFPSCSNDSPGPTQNQNNNGHQPTPVGVPNGIPITATIGVSGGNIISYDSTFEIVIPAGALSANTNITIQPVTNFCYNNSGNAFRLTPEGQAFNVPVTIKLHYSEEVLNSTYNILMGIARQDGSGYWHDLSAISNDTVNRIISAPITNFGFSGDNITGGGDFSFFDIAHIEPRSKNLDVNQTVNLTVTYVAITSDNGDELFYLPKPIHSWDVNGILNGNSVLGTISNQHDQAADYRAPAQVPQPSTVSARATVNTRINRRGQILEQFVLESRIKINSNIYRFHLKINELADWYSHAGYPCFVSDGVDMDLIVNNSTSQITINSIFNRLPNVAPPSGTLPDGSTIQWIQGGPTDVGHVNVTGVNGLIYTSNGREYFSLTFNHANTKNPRFHVIPPSGPDYWLGGEPVSGFPGSVTFVNKDSNQTVIPTGYAWGFSAILTVTQ